MGFYINRMTAYLHFEMHTSLSTVLSRRFYTDFRQNGDGHFTAPKREVNSSFRALQGDVALYTYILVVPPESCVRQDIVCTKISTLGSTRCQNKRVDFRHVVVYRFFRGHFALPFGLVQPK